jgi:hypothetical protein
MARRLPVQAFAHRPPACFEALWRAGALPALVVTAAKGPIICGGGDGMLGLQGLLERVLVQPPPGEQPWYAASAERQQFVMLVLARIGGAAGAHALARTGAGADSLPASDTAKQEELPSLIYVLYIAAEQLAKQPLLRRQLEAAAPDLVARADAAVATFKARSRSADPDAPLLDFGPEPLQLLVALGQQLDPLALGLRLPGCYNPACTCLAGASEAGMALKTCMGCRIAR